MKKQYGLSRPSVLKQLLTTTGALICSSSAPGTASALQSQTQSLQSLRSSLESNLNNWLLHHNAQQETSGQNHKGRSRQASPLNLAQISSNEQAQSDSASAIDLSQLQQLLSSGQLGEAEDGITPEMEAQALAQAQAEAQQQVAQQGAAPSAEELAQAQALAEAQAAAPASTAMIASAAPQETLAVPAAAAPQQLSAVEQAQIEAQAQAEAEAQVQAQQAQVQVGVEEGATQAAAAAALAAQQAETTTAAAPRRPAARSKIQVADTEIANHAAAVAAAASQLFPDEKPWEKMTKAERQAKLAKDAQAKKDKADKEARENPTVDENGEHIQTVAEAKAEAAQLQQMLVAGEQAVEQKIQLDQARMAAEPADTGPVKQEEDDGHLETVEEAKAKMEAAQKAMDEGIAATDNRAQKMQEEEANMPNFGALADVHDTLSNMGKMRKRGQVQSMASKLGVDVQAGDEDLPAADLTNVLIARAQQAGKSEAEITAALE